MQKLFNFIAIPNSHNLDGSDTSDNGHKAIWVSNEIRGQPWKLLYESWATANTLGVDLQAIDLLHDIFGYSERNKKPFLSPKKVIFASDSDELLNRTFVHLCNGPQQKDKVSTSFFGNITHLTIWSYMHRLKTNNVYIPQIMLNVPFKDMKCLTHFAFSTRSDKDSHVTILVYILPGLPGSKFASWDECEEVMRRGSLWPRDATAFPVWAALSEDAHEAEKFGRTVKLPIKLTGEIFSVFKNVDPQSWEKAFNLQLHEDHWKDPVQAPGIVAKIRAFFS